MGHFAWPDEVDTIKFPDGEVDIKKKLTALDHEKLEAQMFKLRVKPTKLGMEDFGPKDFEDIQLATGNLLLLELAITAWRGEGFQDREGKLMPVNLKSIELLDVATKTTLVLEIGARNKILKKV